MFPPNLSRLLATDGIRELQLRRRAWVDYLLGLAGKSRGDVIRMADVSHATVSRTIDGSRAATTPGAPAARVWDAIVELTGVPVEYLKAPPEWGELSATLVLEHVAAHG